MQFHGLPFRVRQHTGYVETHDSVVYVAFAIPVRVMHEPIGICFYAGID